MQLVHPARVANVFQVVLLVRHAAMEQVPTNVKTGIMARHAAIDIVNGAPRLARIHAINVVTEFHKLSICKIYRSMKAMVNSIKI